MTDSMTWIGRMTGAATMVVIYRHCVLGRRQRLAPQPCGSRGDGQLSTTMSATN
jgi:hypothetical protein